MDLFNQLRHLYVNVGNDVRHLQEKASRPRLGLSHLQADKLFNEPLSDVRLEQEKVKAKIKELQEETHFGEVVTCCSDVVNDALAQLDQLEHHLQKYSVQPIGNARQQVEIQSSVSSKESNLPSASCNPISTAVVVVTESCQPRVKEWPMSYQMAPTPKLSDFGISESYTRRLDEVTAAILKRSQMSHASVGQGHEGSGIFNSSIDPCAPQPLHHSSPTGADSYAAAAATSQNQLDVGAIRCHDQNQGGISSKKPVGKSISNTNLSYEPSNITQSLNALSLVGDENDSHSSHPYPLHGMSLPRLDVGLSGYEAAFERLESSTQKKAFGLSIPSPPQLSDTAKKALDYRAAARDRTSVFPKSVKKEFDLSPSLNTTLLSEQTVNILRQLQLSKISTSSIKLEPYSTEKTGENIPPDYPSMRKSRAVDAGNTAAKRCLDLGVGEQTRDTAPGHNFHQNVVSTTDFVPKKCAAADVTVTDQTYNIEGSSVKSLPCVTESSSVHGHGDGTNNRTGKGSSGHSRLGSEGWTCPHILPFSVDDYESFVPAAVKNIATLERINDCIGKANDVLLKKILDGSSMSLSADDLKHAVGSNASLFLRLMAKTGRLSEKRGEHGVVNYNLN